MTQPISDDAQDPNRGRQLQPWVRHYWWALVIAGAVLMVVGVLIQRDLLTIGDPFMLGVLCLVAGLVGGIHRYRGHRA